MNNLLRQNKVEYLYLPNQGPPNKIFKDCIRFIRAEFMDDEFSANDIRSKRQENDGPETKKKDIMMYLDQMVKAELLGNQGEIYWVEERFRQIDHLSPEEIVNIVPHLDDLVRYLERYNGLFMDKLQSQDTVNYPILLPSSDPLSNYEIGRILEFDRYEPEAFLRADNIRWQDIESDLLPKITGQYQDKIDVDLVDAIQEHVIQISRQEEGNQIGLIGDVGSGKSTITRIIGFELQKKRYLVLLMEENDLLRILENENSKEAMSLKELTDQFDKLCLLVEEVGYGHNETVDLFENWKAENWKNTEKKSILQLWIGQGDIEFESNSLITYQTRPVETMVSHAQKMLSSIYRRQEDDDIVFVLAKLIARICEGDFWMYQYSIRVLLGEEFLDMNPVTPSQSAELDERWINTDEMELRLYVYQKLKNYFIERIQEIAQGTSQRFEIVLKHYYMLLVLENFGIVVRTVIFQQTVGIDDKTLQYLEDAKLLKIENNEWFASFHPARIDMLMETLLPVLVGERYPTLKGDIDNDKHIKEILIKEFLQKVPDLDVILQIRNEVDFIKDQDLSITYFYVLDSKEIKEEQLQVPLDTAKQLLDEEISSRFSLLFPKIWKTNIDAWILEVAQSGYDYTHLDTLRQLNLHVAKEVGESEQLHQKIRKYIEFVLFRDDTIIYDQYHQIRHLVQEFTPDLEPYGKMLQNLKLRNGQLKPYKELLNDDKIIAEILMRMGEFRESFEKNLIRSGIMREEEIMNLQIEELDYDINEQLKDWIEFVNESSEVLQQSPRKWIEKLNTFEHQYGIPRQEMMEKIDPLCLAEEFKKMDEKTKREFILDFIIIFVEYKFDWNTWLENISNKEVRMVHKLLSNDLFYFKNAWMQLFLQSKHFQEIVLSTDLEQRLISIEQKRRLQFQSSLLFTRDKDKLEKDKHMDREIRKFCSVVQKINSHLINIALNEVIEDIKRQIEDYAYPYYNEYTFQQFRKWMLDKKSLDMVDNIEEYHKLFSTREVNPKFVWNRIEKVNDWDLLVKWSTKYPHILEDFMTRILPYLQTHHPDIIEQIRELWNENYNQYISSFYKKDRFRGYYLDTIIFNLDRIGVDNQVLIELCDKITIISPNNKQLIEWLISKTKSQNNYKRKYELILTRASLTTNLSYSFQSISEKDQAEVIIEIINQNQTGSRLYNLQYLSKEVKNIVGRYLSKNFHTAKHDWFWIGKSLDEIVKIPGFKIEYLLKFLKNTPREAKRRYYENEYDKLPSKTLMEIWELPEEKFFEYFVNHNKIRTYDNLRPILEMVIKIEENQQTQNYKKLMDKMSPIGHLKLIGSGEWRQFKHYYQKLTTDDWQKIVNDLSPLNGFVLWLQYQTEFDKLKVIQLKRGFLEKIPKNNHVYAFLSALDHVYLSKRGNG